MTAKKRRKYAINAVVLIFIARIGKNHHRQGIKPIGKDHGKRILDTRALNATIYQLDDE